MWNAHTYTYGDTNADSDAYGDAHTDAHAHSHSDGYGHANANANSYGDAHANAHSHGDVHANGHGDSDIYADTDAYSHAQTYADAQAAADASSAGVALSGPLIGGNSRDTSREFPASGGRVGHGSPFHPDKLESRRLALLWPAVAWRRREFAVQKSKNNVDTLWRIQLKRRFT